MSRLIKGRAVSFLLRFPFRPSVHPTGCFRMKMAKSVAATDKNILRVRQTAAGLGDFFAPRVWKQMGGVGCERS